MTTITLEQYEEAERRLAHEGAYAGVVIHALVTVLVSIGLVLINLFVAPEFPWSPFPVAGMTIGLYAHWWFGYRKLDETLARKQRDVEGFAAKLS